MARILVDMDGVMCNTLPSWFEVINKEYGLDKKPEDLTEWELTSVYPDIRPEKLVSYLAEPGFFRHLPVLDNCQAVLQTFVEQGHDVVIVTARNYSFEDSRNWIKDHFPFLERDALIYCKRKYLVNGDILIDDKLQNIDEFAANGDVENLGILYESNYTKGIDFSCNERKIKAKNWKEVYDLVTDYVNLYEGK